MRTVKQILVNDIASKVYGWDLETLIEHAVETIKNEMNARTIEELTDMVQVSNNFNDAEFESFISKELLLTEYETDMRDYNVLKRK